MWSEISMVKTPDEKLIKLFTKVLSMRKHEDADMHVGFDITCKNACVCILLWKTEELFEDSVLFIKLKLNSPANFLS